MIAPHQAVIDPLVESQLEPFLHYVNDHLRGNGLGESGYFQPLPAGAGLPPAKADAIRVGLGIPIGEPGWRRAWVARDSAGELIAHIDLRGRSEPFTAHRCLLGMGVHRRMRGQGLGARMLAHALRWAREQLALDWVDLEVISTNAAAIRLYERAGFARVGQIDDLFRVEGRSLASTTMSKRLRDG